MAHTALGSFQGDADWLIEVRVAGFDSAQAAERYAMDFDIQLNHGSLFRSDGAASKARLWKEVLDGDVTLSRLKPAARNLLTVSELDYGVVSLPISQWHNHDGLTCGFELLAYAVS